MEELKQQLIKDINEASSRLSAEAIYYIVKDLFRDIEDSYVDYLKRKDEQKNQKDIEKEE